MLFVTFRGGPFHLFIVGIPQVSIILFISFFPIKIMSTFIINFSFSDFSFCEYKISINASCFSPRLPVNADVASHSTEQLKRESSVERLMENVFIWSS